MQSISSPVLIRQKAALLAIKPEIALLTQSRAAFVAENQLYRAQLQNSSVIALTPEQNLRLQARQNQQNSLLAGTQMEIEQAKQQYLQNQTQLVNAKEVLEINQKILKNLDSLAKKGAYPRLQTLKQEYGDIKGELIEIGSDALPPDQVYQYWRLRAKVRLTGQTLQIAGRHVPLQSGMSINANVKLRKRTIMSIFTDFLVQKTESLKFVR